MKISFPNTWLKVATTWLGVFFFRFLLLTFRAPNVEPMLASVMPLSRRLGAVGAFAFAFFGIVIYDFATLRVGPWTWVTAVAYGILATASFYYFKAGAFSRARFVGFGVVATLVYDAATGFTVGPIFFHQPLSAAIAGQVPFTVLHLLGTVVFALFLSPVLARWVASERMVTASLGDRKVVH